ncbi:MAG: DUF5706 domain-containing protein [Gemmatimonadota bacterium]|nr:DUF5706 domain-containing protein [Gemmatimonadota bacterium]
MTDDERLEDRLRYILGFVEGHVKFAETKNAALLVVNTTAVAGAIQLLSSATGPNLWFARYLDIFAFFNALSGVIALLSFLPITSLSWFVKRGKSADSDSLLFFGDSQKYDVRSYLKGLYSASGIEVGSFSPLHRMYAEQIINNSRIAWRKFSYFRAGTWATIAGVLTPVAAAILFYIVNTYDSLLESS